MYVCVCVCVSLSLYIYIYIQTYTNMTKYCASNCKIRYNLNFKYSRNDTYVFSKNMFDFL